jgi:hypothetical protein
MKEIYIKIDDDLYRRASQKVLNLEDEVNQYIIEYLESMNSRDAGILAARTRMVDLFAATKNFSVGLTPARDEMHERVKKR